MSTDQKRSLIAPGFVDMSVNKQCKLIDLQRSNFYFKPKGESGLNLILMELYKGIKKYVEFYNSDRRHESLRYETPNVFFSQDEKVS